MAARVLSSVSGHRWLQVSSVVLSKRLSDEEFDGRVQFVVDELQVGGTPATRHRALSGRSAAGGVGAACHDTPPGMPGCTVVQMLGLARSVLPPPIGRFTHATARTILPWRGCGTRDPWAGVTTAEKTAAVAAVETSARPSEAATEAELRRAGS